MFFPTRARSGPEGKEGRAKPSTLIGENSSGFRGNFVLGTKCGEHAKDIFSFIKDYEWAVYLCSNHKKFKNQRYDIITCSPIQKIYSYINKTIVESNDIKLEYHDDPIDILAKIMKDYDSDILDLPFTGGAIGLSLIHI